MVMIFLCIFVLFFGTNKGTLPQRAIMSAIILSFRCGHEEPPGVNLRAVIVWLEDRNERSAFALEFCGGFVAVGTF